MATSLIQGASSAYINAQNALRSKRALPEVYVYVEGLDDVAFWKECLRPFSTNYSFKVSQLRKPDGSIAEGKRHLIDCIGVQSLGPNKYLAVDADYDWIIDEYRPSPSSTSISNDIRKNPYILHTFLYSIENYKCHPLCVAGMMDKIAGTSNEEEILRFFGTFSNAMSELFLLHLVSIECCDGKYTLKDFKKDVDTLTFEKDTMELDKGSGSYVSQRLWEMQDYVQEKRLRIEGYRQKLKELGFDESKYFLLMQGHIVENILVKKHLPGKILRIRKEILNAISNCSNEMQADKRIKQFERVTGITSTNASNQPKSAKTLLKEINTRLDQLIFDCTDVRKAVEGYSLLSRSLEQAFGKPSY